MEQPQESEKTRGELLGHLQHTQISLFECIRRLWMCLAGPNNLAYIKSINLELRRRDTATRMHGGLQHDEARIVKFLQSTLDLDLELPSLPQLEEAFVDGRRALAFWPALTAIKIAATSPLLIMEYRARDFSEW